MPNENEYKTVEIMASDEFTEKKSRFIGYCAPVSTADEAMEFVTQIKKKHYDARHNCFAYILKSGELRFSDDGEPQGTAGQPILDVLQRGGFYDCAVVVTRYFGGVLLGTGGLTRAYTNGAKIAVAAAKPIVMVSRFVCGITLDYSLYGSLQTLISRYGALVHDSDFADFVTLELYVPPENYDKFCDDITEMSAGKLSLVKKSTVFVKKCD